MKNLPITNIHWDSKNIWIFCRDMAGKLTKYIDKSWRPYYYTAATTVTPNTVLGYNNNWYEKTAIRPAREESANSAETDVFPQDKFCQSVIDGFTPCPVRMCFMDIEVLCDQLPEPQLTKVAPYPISCITVYDNFTQQYKTFYLGDYSSDKELIKAFIIYVRNLEPDILAGWNMAEFDWTYLSYRYPNIAVEISPVQRRRFNNLPVGISVVDYMGWYKKVYTKGRKSYALNSIALHELGAGKINANVDFSKLDAEIIKRNTEDVEILVKLEEKLHLLDYFANIRQQSLVDWEYMGKVTKYIDGKRVEISNNSKIWDALYLKEAYKKGMILPNRPLIKEEGSYQGATRKALKKGLFTNVMSFDISGAYPSMIILFNLDASNIVSAPSDRTVTINGIHFLQNSEAIIPTVIKKMLANKNEIKKQYPGTPAYDAAKAICNSGYGVLGCPSFRLYDKRVADTITFLVRDLLLFTVNYLQDHNIEVLYYDTDGIMVKQFGYPEDDHTLPIIQATTEWLRKYGKEEGISFEYEHTYDKIFIQDECRYIAHYTENGVEKEIVKGMDTVRSDVSEFQQWFIGVLMNMIFEGMSKIDIWKYVDEITKIFQGDQDGSGVSIEKMSYPFKITNKEYKVNTATLQAVNYAKKRGKVFRNGDLVKWVYIIPQDFEYEDKKVPYLNGKKFTKTTAKIQLRKHPNLTLDKIEGYLASIGELTYIPIKKVVYEYDKIAFSDVKELEGLQIDNKKMLIRNVLQTAERVLVNL